MNDFFNKVERRKQQVENAAVMLNKAKWELESLRQAFEDMGGMIATIGANRFNNPELMDLLDCLSEKERIYKEMEANYKGAGLLDEDIDDIVKNLY